MTDRERNQADLLDGFMNHLDGGHSTPPDDLDPALASVAVMLAAELTPPEPSARFVRRLDQQLTAVPVTSNNHHQATLSAAASTELTLQTAPADWREAAVGPRRSRLSAFAHLAAAVLAIMLIGSVLIFKFSDRDEISSPGILAPTSITESEILVSWDPAGANNYKLYIVPFDGSEPRKLTPGPHENDGITERLASWSPDGQRVAYVHQENGQNDIYVTDGQPASVPVNITSSPYSETTPVWSPDGSQIAFVRSAEGESVANIHVMNVDGSDQRQLTHSETGAFHPAWSPDGSQIAFVTRTAGGSQRVWVMNADGSGQRWVSALGTAVGFPVWSPDGERILFELLGEVWAADPNGESEQLKLTGGTRVVSSADWSPDGRGIVYVSGNNDEALDGNQITTIDVSEALKQAWMSRAGETGPLAQWTTEADVADWPIWSPDGHRIAFHAGVDQNEGQGEVPDITWGLHLAAPDGIGERTLLDSGIDYTWPPAWRPVLLGVGDIPNLSRQILVSWDPHGGEDYKLFVVHAATGEIRKLTPGPAEVDGVSERYGSWSPDGQQVVFVREEGSQSDTYVMNAHPGSEPKNLTSSSFRDTAPMWSPDGSQIVWVSSSMEQGEVANIHVMDADGSNQRQLTHLDTGAFSPAWSPGGTQIAYVVRSMDFLQVWLMDADGGNAHAITEIDESFTLQESFTPRLAWSPDGQSIAFGTGSTIRTVSTDGSDNRDLQEGDLIAMSNPGWSANGQRLAYAFVDPETGFNGIALAGTSGMHVENWRPPEVDHVDAPSWSPDGTLIAFYGGSGDEEVVWDLRVSGSLGAGHRILVGSGVDHLWAPNWRPTAGETPPAPASTPTPQVVPTPIDQPSATPEILTEPPRASLTYQDQTQTHGAHTYCWPEPLRTGEMGLTCSEADRGPPDLPAIHMPAGASLSFEFEGGHAFTPLGAEAVRLIPYPEPSTTDLTFDFPGTGIPFEQGPDGTFLIADVPDGDYAFEVRIAMDVYPGHQGDASYAFRVIVGDPSLMPTPALGGPPADVPSAWMTYDGESQRGEFAYGCNWPGYPICVDPGGLMYPAEFLNIPEGAE